MTTLGVETAGTTPVQQLSNNAVGVTMGQSTTDLISFYNATPVVQPTNSVDVVTALVNLGLLASGTYQITGQTTASTNNSASTASSLTATAIPPTGYTKVNSTATQTFYLSAPIAGTEKFLFQDAGTSAIVVTINTNSTNLGTSLVKLIPLAGSSLDTAGSSLGNIVITNTSVVGAGITLVGISATEWVVKNTNSTLITYTT